MGAQVKPRSIRRVRDLIEYARAGGDTSKIDNHIRLSDMYHYFRENPDRLLPLSEVHRASEFAAFLQRGAKRLLLSGYDEGPDVWRQAVNSETSVGPFETYPNLGALATPRRREPGEPFPTLKFTSEDVRVTNLEYGGLIEIDITLIEDDQTKKIQAQPTSLGRGHQRLRNTTVFGTYNDNAAIYDGQTWFAAGGHPNVTGGAVVPTNTNNGALGTISEGNLETALAEIMLWQGLQGEIINVDPVVLLYTAQDFAVVERLLGPFRQVVDATRAAIGPAGSNVLAGRVRPVLAKWLTAGAWYVLTNVPGLVLQERVALDVTQEQTNAGMSFDQAVWRFRSRERWGLGVVDWRKGYKGN